MWANDTVSVKTQEAESFEIYSLGELCQIMFNIKSVDFNNTSDIWMLFNKALMKSPIEEISWWNISQSYNNKKIQS